MPSHDVLIIGAGLAGQRAALSAAEAGASVAIVSKVHPVRSHSVAAAGGINAALNPEDSWESHAFDTVKGSDYLGDQDAIEIMAREAPSEILYLEHVGVTFHRNESGHLGTRVVLARRERRHDRVVVAVLREYSGEPAEKLAICGVGLSWKFTGPVGAQQARRCPIVGGHIKSFDRMRTRT